MYLKQTVKWLKHSHVTQRISDGVLETNSEVVEALICGGSVMVYLKQRVKWLKHS